MLKKAASGFLGFLWCSDVAVYAPLRHNGHALGDAASNMVALLGKTF